MADEWIELHGDRAFGDDPAIVAGFARIGERRIVVVGQQKGADTDENIRRNFGMPHPEGYRKAMRAMELAERFSLPVVSFIDVPGAHPGPESEERGIADAIARSIALQGRLRTPIVAIITGEGGSGGALAIAVGDVVIALENAVYSVISPEGCASILWRTPDEAPAAALAMRMTAADQQALGVVDVVVPEPGEGAHTDHAETARRLRQVIVGAARASSSGFPSTPSSRRATGATGRSGPTLRSPRRRSPSPSDPASATGCATCSTRGAGRAWDCPVPAAAAMSRPPARRSSPCPRPSIRARPPLPARPTDPSGAPPRRVSATMPRSVGSPSSSCPRWWRS